MFIKVKHWHDQNDPDGRHRKSLIGHELMFIPAKGRAYVTEAKLIKNGAMVASGIAVCHPKDQPCRSKGYAVAMRKLTEYINSNLKGM